MDSSSSSYLTSPKSNLDGSTQSKFFDLSHNTAEIARSSSSYPHSQEKSNQNQDATTTTTATGVSSSKKTCMFDSLNGEGDKKNIMMKARLLIQTIMNVAFFKSGYKNPLALPIEGAMTQRAAMEFEVIKDGKQSNLANDEKLSSSLVKIEQVQQILNALKTEVDGVKKE
ncbi:hypothetical protein QAD02_020693 [Eretmocerus hayati]|uniref:Uncharacterized protein n=1 Tax=Eretmocerus hayati TaxID=131215 RepID=A0ACC2PSW3_9HYME|nr:hypothetical protein QAD02_020693 [Eretmocerus hayati]